MGLKNIDLLHELNFHNKLNIYEMSKAFGGMQELIKLTFDSKDSLGQLEASK